jgi:hypothetical protein
MGPDGLLLRVTPSEVVAHHLPDGTLAWRLALTGNTILPLGLAGGDLLFVQQDNEGVLAIDTAVGQVRSRLATMPAGAITGRVKLRAVEQQWHLMTAAMASAVGPDGQLRWRDAVLSGADKQFQRQLIGERFVVLLSLTKSPQAAAAPFQLLPPQAGQVQQAKVVRRLGQNGVLEIRIEGGVGRVELQGQNLALEPEAPLDGAEPPPGGWVYELLFLDRQSGVLTHQQPLAPLPTMLDPTRSVFLNNCLVLSTSSSTIVIPGAGK